jgi:hypothetical protein
MPITAASSRSATSMAGGIFMPAGTSAQTLALEIVHHEDKQSVARPFRALAQRAIPLKSTR